MVNDVILYKTDDGKSAIELHLDNGTVWLSQQELAELFQTSKQNISKHIKAIFEDGELSEEATVNYKLTVQNEGSRSVQRNVAYYNLDMILAIGYRVRSPRGIQFRHYASTVLKEYLIKGFAMDDERLKNLGGGSYFKELLERIRDIRSSEKVFYRQVLDLFATSSDYNANSPEAKKFFATVQNKMHYAVHGNTAAEVIVARADHNKEHMGLKSWKNVPDGKIVKTDVSIAKNYLEKEELAELNEIVTMYLDYATRQARRHIPMTMEDWKTKLDAFLRFNDADVLQDKGKVTAAIAKEFAESEFEKYRVIQDSLYESDFDKLMNDMEKNDAIH